ncbi:unnamed protein product [Haemonchus placei]|uniref:EGF-like domain-containing protein n=1 Tax=Haemonchus placei TaxID=6290 RepID=A0A0N4WZN0_HAEPC|nr:unnamed protein product [Haemonchus placei]
MDQGCRCPPGFLGASCEPVQCVPGTSHSFYEETEKQSLYVLVTYNSFMNATIVKNKDDPIVAVCQAVRNLTIPSLYWSIDAPLVNKILTGQDTTVQECVDDAKSMCDPPSSCDPNTLTIENINSIIDQSQPNSQVLIITNSALNQTLSADETIKKAIARRIKAISQIINFISNNYAPVAVRPAKTVQQFHYTVDRRNKFYIAFRSLGIEPEDITFTTQPTGLTLEQDTGFWKLYSAQEKSGKTNFTLQYTGSASDFNVQVLSPSVLNTFAAVSSSDSVDASSPYGTIGAQRTVVARVLNGNTPVTENLSVNMSAGIQFTPDVKERSDCQFSVSLGTVECKESSYGVLSVVSSDGKGSAVPFLCSNEVRISKDNQMNRLSGQQLATLDGSPKCSSELKDSPLVEVLPLKRTFTIIARNVKDTSNIDGSTVDNVFIYPNNILDYLVSYLTENPGYYTTYLANIFPFENPNAAYQTPDLTSFITYVMKTVHSATENNRKARFNYSVALQNSLFVHESYTGTL